MQKLLALSLASLVALVTLAPLGQAAEMMAMTGTSGSGGGHIENTTCVRSAIATREASVRSSYATMMNGMLAALDTRATALANAWMLEDKTARRSARDTAWKTWKNTSKTTRETYRNARDTAWKTFHTSIKACNARDVEPSSARYSDAQ
jgi:hypothetical protein